jgi:Major Facilitator Superfamily
MRRVLQIPAYRRLIAAYTLNEVGWAMAMVALSFLVYHQTGSAVGAAAYWICSLFLPGLFSPLLVARVDQLPVRPVLAALYAVDAGLFLALAWIAGRFAVAPVLVLIVVDGILSAAARSLGRAATVSVTIPAGLLREGNALANTLYVTGYLVGPAVGGAIVATNSVSTALLADAGVFAAMAVTLGSAAGLPGSVERGTTRTGRLRAAFDYARHHRMLRALMMLMATGIVFFTISMPVEVVYAQRSLHAGAAGYGFLISSWGGGAVLGSTVYMRWRARPSRQLLAAAAGLLGLGCVGLAAAPVLWVAMVVAGVAGVGNGMYGVATRTAVQEVVEDRWMAMMMSFYESVTMFAPGLGIVLGGALTALSTPRIAWLAAGVGALAVMALTWVVLAPAGRQTREATAGTAATAAAAATAANGRATPPAPAGASRGAPPPPDRPARRTSPSSAAPPV